MGGYGRGPTTIRPAARPASDGSFGSLRPRIVGYGSTVPQPSLDCNLTIVLPNPDASLTSPRPDGIGADSAT